VNTTCTRGLIHSLPLKAAGHTEEVCEKAVFSVQIMPVYEQRMAFFTGKILPFFFVKKDGLKFFENGIKAVLPVLSSFHSGDNFYQ